MKLIGFSEMATSVWKLRVFQAMVAVLLVMHLIWPPLLIPTIGPLLDSSGLDIFWDYDDYQYHQGKVLDDVAIIFFSWIFIAFWIALSIGLIRFVPVARGLLLLTLLLSGITYLLWPRSSFDYGYELAPGHVVIALDVVVLLLAFLPPVAQAFSGYREGLRTHPHAGSFPFFRPENLLPVFITVAILAVFVGNRLAVEDWAQKVLTQEEMLASLEKELAEAKKSKEPHAIETAYGVLAWGYRSHGKYENAVKTYESAYADTGEEEYARQAATLYATAPDRRARDGNKAIAITTKLLKSTGDDYARAVLLDILAAAYAEAGDFDKAISTAEAAIMTLLKTDDVYQIKDYAWRLLSYRDGEPWRDS
jgi:tetratricopeptide (TPR) repeat protein